MACDKVADYQKALERIADTPLGRAGFQVPTEPEEEKVSHSSGATSSHFSPFTFYPTYEGVRLTSLRFKEGNRKHENSDPIYSNANWLKAFKARDVAFFRDRAGHAMEHLIDEMRGVDDKDPGGNLGAVGWFQDVMAYVKKNDPFLYGAIQGKWNINDRNAEANFLGQDVPTK